MAILNRPLTDKEVRAMLEEDIEALEAQGTIEQLEKQLAHARERLNRTDNCFLIVHDLIESAREDVRLKVENAPAELVQALNMALYAIRSR